MRRVFFAIFCLWIFNNVAFAAMCNAEYYNDNGSCVRCSGNKYCPGDDIAYDCPSAREYQRTSYPDSEVLQISSCSNISSPFAKNISECSIICYVTHVRGAFIDYAYYNEASQEYDRTWLTLWYSVNPGYYLSDRGSCGSYAYYKKVNVCKAGSYCPGKKHVVCNSSNQAVVHTLTFGMEPCPDGYWSDAGASECTGKSIQINWERASQEDINVNNADECTYGGDIRTPRAAEHIPGKTFIGWTFNVQ